MTGISVRLISMVTLTLAQVPAAAEQWQIGLAAQSFDSAISERQQQQTVLPMVNYLGERLRFVAGVLTYSVVQSKDYQVSAISQLRDEGYAADDSQALRGMDDRELGLDAGVGVVFPVLGGELQLTALRDVSGRSQGSEFKTAYLHAWQRGSWTIQPALGVSWKSDAMVDYYYGVTAAEASGGRPAYQGSAATNPYVAINLIAQLDRRWTVMAGSEITALDATIADSPIVEDTTQVRVYSALLYDF